MAGNQETLSLAVNKERVAAAAAKRKRPSKATTATAGRTSRELYADLVRVLEFCLRGLQVDASAADGDSVSGQIVNLLGYAAATTVSGDI